MTRKNVISLVSFILVAVLMVGMLSHLMRDKESSFDNYYLEPENTIDALFVGSSHVYSGYCPALLWEEYGVSAYNVYAWSMPIWTGYYYLSEALKTQSPEVVFIDMSSMCMADGVLGASEKGSDNREQNLWFASGKERFLLTLESYTPDSELFDLELFHNKWKHPEKIEWSHVANTDLGPLRNFGALYDQYEFEIFNFSFLEDIYEPSPTAKKYLDKVVQLSETEGFRLVFIMTPYSANEQQNGVSNWVHQYAEAHGIDYLDFMKDAGVECGFDYKLDMADNDHVNVGGALKLTRYCGDYLRSIGICDRWDNPVSERLTSHANATYRMLSFSEVFVDGLQADTLAEWLVSESSYSVAALTPKSLSVSQISFLEKLGLSNSPSAASIADSGELRLQEAIPSLGESFVPENFGCSLMATDDSFKVMVGSATEMFATDNSNICLAYYDGYWNRLVYAISIEPDGTVTWKEYTSSLRGAAQ